MNQLRLNAYSQVLGRYDIVKIHTLPVIVIKMDGILIIGMRIVIA